jgi:hypothetical protein
MNSDNLKRHTETIHEGIMSYKTSQKANLAKHKCKGGGEAYYQKLIQAKYNAGSRTTPAASLIS